MDNKLYLFSSAPWLDRDYNRVRRLRLILTQKEQLFFNLLTTLAHYKR